MNTVNIWQQLPKPFFCLAPMEDVTDSLFRQMLVSCGRPEVFFTEFTNVDGLCSLEGEKVVSRRLQFDPVEKPLIVQLWGNNPEVFSVCAEKVSIRRFDGIDINMGCPQKKVVKNNCGAALIGNFDLSNQIIKAVKKNANGLPVSVKTRLGKKNFDPQWFEFLLQQDLAVLTIHGRTVSQGFGGTVDWSAIGEIVKLKNKLNPQVKVIGNGNIESRIDGLEKAAEYQLDGIMIGRAALKNPWIFSEHTDVTREERIRQLIKHLELFQYTYQNTIPAVTMRKFYCAYIADFSGAATLRTQLMTAKTIPEALKILSAA